MHKYYYAAFVSPTSEQYILFIVYCWNNDNPCCNIVSDLPLILILSVYTDFLTVKFSKIQIFPLKLGEIQIFTGVPKVFSYTVLIHTDFFPKILIFLVIYTDFVSDPSGRSVVLKDREYIFPLFKTFIAIAKFYQQR